MSTRRRLRAAASEVFGWPELRDEQIDAMEQVLAGRDVFVVPPTGAGKSAVYQVPGVLLDGLVVVVSPLIALQRDQVAALRESGAPPAVLVNSAQSEVDNKVAWEAVERGEVRYLFVSPEQLAKPGVVDRLGRPSVSTDPTGHWKCGGTRRPGRAGGSTCWGTSARCWSGRAGPATRALGARRAPVCRPTPSTRRSPGCTTRSGAAGRWCRARRTG
ncbi:hypothetical protein ALI22I_44460 [Saccharothrix sp. ALI-22-I]|nr:hypothetical protein ALI22I_44460 [Saccharothrix sp. ALI-22-I]